LDFFENFGFFLKKIENGRAKITDFNFSHFFCELGLKMLGPQQWQLLHVEKDDQVI
jgi:hypothetical protein